MFEGLFRFELPQNSCNAFGLINTVKYLDSSLSSPCDQRRATAVCHANELSCNLYKQKVIAEQCSSSTSCTALRALESHRTLTLRTRAERQMQGFNSQLLPLLWAPPHITTHMHHTQLHSLTLPYLCSHTCISFSVQVVQQIHISQCYARNNTGLHNVTAPC